MRAALSRVSKASQAAPSQTKKTKLTLWQHLNPNQQQQLAQHLAELIRQQQAARENADMAGKAKP